MSQVSDTHGNVLLRLEKIKYLYPDFIPNETAVIILGDAGINFYLNKSEYNKKKRIAAAGYSLYLVRGNHEERPQNLGMGLEWDKNVQGPVYYESDFPNIRYLQDGGEYTINNHSTLVIGGAYSVDKWYRLSDRPEDTTEWTGWFKDEQLTLKEKINILEKVQGKHYDLVLTHTCPFSWEYLIKYLFLGNIDQSKIDKSMEHFLDDVIDNITYDYYYFGHYHDDQNFPIVKATMLFEDIRELF